MFNLNQSQKLLIVVMAVSLYVVYRLFRLLFASRFRKSQPGMYAPLLLAYYSNGSQLLASASQEAGDLTLTFFVATSRTAATGSDVLENAIRGADSIMASVHLPFNSASHIVGITQAGSEELGLQEFLARRKLEVIELEGDFPSTFLLYAPSGNQFNARYLLDPKAMAFVVDFCKTNHFEIVGDMLYIASNAATESASSQDYFSVETIQKFVSEIKPALVTHESGLHKNPAHRTYGQAKNNMVCPRCSIKLTNFSEGIHKCLRGDGILISGATMTQLRKETIRLNSIQKSSNEEAAEIHCPNCDNLMHHVDYQKTGVVIDACVHCGYRWLDHGEDAFILK